LIFMHTVRKLSVITCVFRAASSTSINDQIPFCRVDFDPKLLQWNHYEIDDNDYKEFGKYFLIIIEAL
jgi:hypothetical protein